MVNEGMSIAKKLKINGLKISAVSILLIMLISVVQIQPKDEKVNDAVVIDYTIRYVADLNGDNDVRDAGENIFYKVYYDYANGGAETTEVMTQDELVELGYVVETGPSNNLNISGIYYTSIKFSGLNIVSTQAVAFETVGNVCINFKDGSSNSIKSTYNANADGYYGIKSSDALYVSNSGILEISCSNEETSGTKECVGVYSEDCMWLTGNSTIEGDMLTINANGRNGIGICSNNGDYVYTGRFDINIYAGTSGDVAGIKGNKEVWIWDSKTYIEAKSSDGTAHGILVQNNGMAEDKDDFAVVENCSFRADISSSIEGAIVESRKVEIYDNTDFIGVISGTNVCGIKSTGVSGATDSGITIKEDANIHISGDINGTNNPAAIFADNADVTMESESINIDIKNTVNADKIVGIIATNDVISTAGNVTVNGGSVLSKVNNNAGAGIEASNEFSVQGGVLISCSTGQATTNTSVTLNTTSTEKRTKVMAVATDMNATALVDYDESKLNTYKYIKIGQISNYYLQYDALNGTIKKVALDGVVGDEVTSIDVPGWEIVEETIGGVAKKVLVLKGLEFQTVASKAIEIVGAEGYIRVQDSTVSNITMKDYAGAENTYGISTSGFGLEFMGAGTLNIDISATEGTTYAICADTNNVKVSNSTIKSKINAKTVEGITAPAGKIILNKGIINMVDVNSTTGSSNLIYGKTGVEISNNSDIDIKFASTENTRESENAEDYYHKQSLIKSLGVINIINSYMDASVDALSIDGIVSYDNNVNINKTQININGKGDIVAGIKAASINEKYGSSVGTITISNGTKYNINVAQKEEEKATYMMSHIYGVYAMYNNIVFNQSSSEMNLGSEDYNMGFYSEDGHIEVKNSNLKMNNTNACFYFMGIYTYSFPTEGKTDMKGDITVENTNIIFDDDEEILYSYLIDSTRGIININKSNIQVLGWEVGSYGRVFNALDEDICINLSTININNYSGCSDSSTLYALDAERNIELEDSLINISSETYGITAFESVDTTITDSVINCDLNGAEAQGIVSSEEIAITNGRISIKAGKQAINTPTLNMTNVDVLYASENYDGSNLVNYDENNQSLYKYLLISKDNTYELKYIVDTGKITDSNDAVLSNEELAAYGIAIDGTTKALTLSDVSTETEKENKINAIELTTDKEVGLWIIGDVQINMAKYNVYDIKSTGNTGTDCYGIKVVGNLRINQNGTFNFLNESGSSSTTDYCGIAAEDITFTKGSLNYNVTTNATEGNTYGLYVNNLYLLGGNNEIKLSYGDGVTSSNKLYAIHCNYTYRSKAGRVYIEMDKNNANVCGVEAGEKIDIVDGALEIHAATVMNRAPILTSSNVSISEARIGENWTIPNQNVSNIANYDYVRIESNYSLYLVNGNLTKSYTGVKAEVPNWYIDENGVIVFDGFVFSTSSRWGIRIDGNKIVDTGANSENIFILNARSNSGSASMAILGYNSLTMRDSNSEENKGKYRVFNKYNKSEGSVMGIHVNQYAEFHDIDIELDANLASYHGIAANKDMLMDNCNINFRSVEITDYYGRIIVCYGKATINDSNININFKATEKELYTHTYEDGSTYTTYDNTHVMLYSNGGLLMTDSNVNMNVEALCVDGISAYGKGLTLDNCIVNIKGRADVFFSSYVYVGSDYKGGEDSGTRLINTEFNVDMEQIDTTGLPDIYSRFYGMYCGGDKLQADSSKIDIKFNLEDTQYVCGMTSGANLLLYNSSIDFFASGKINSNIGINVNEDLNIDNSKVTIKDDNMIEDNETIIRYAQAMTSFGNTNITNNSQVIINIQMEEENTYEDDNENTMYEPSYLVLAPYGQINVSNSLIDIDATGNNLKAIQSYSDSINMAGATIDIDTTAIDCDAISVAKYFDEELETTPKIDITDSDVDINNTLRENVTDKITDPYGIQSDFYDVNIASSNVTIDMETCNDTYGIYSKLGSVNIEDKSDIGIDLLSTTMSQGIIADTGVKFDSSTADIRVGKNDGDSQAIVTSNFVTQGIEDGMLTTVLEGSTIYRSMNETYNEGELVIYSGKNDSSYKYIKIGEIPAYYYSVDMANGAVSKVYSTDGTTSNLVTTAIATEDLPTGMSFSINAQNEYVLNLDSFEFSTVAPLGLVLTGSKSNVNIMGTNTINLVEDSYNWSHPDAAIYLHTDNNVITSDDTGVLNLNKINNYGATDVNYYGIVQKNGMTKLVINNGTYNINANKVYNLHGIYTEFNNYTNANINIDANVENEAYGIYSYMSVSNYIGSEKAFNMNNCNVDISIDSTNAKSYMYGMYIGDMSSIVQGRDVENNILINGGSIEVDMTGGFITGMIIKSKKAAIMNMDRMIFDIKALPGEYYAAFGLESTGDLNMENNSVIAAVEGDSEKSYAFKVLESSKIKGKVDASNTYSKPGEEPTDLVTVIEFEKNNNNYKYVKIEPSVITVDITWGALNYKYNYGLWNTSTRIYDGRGWQVVDKEGNPSADGDKISINNRSNVPVNASVTYSSEAEYVSDIIGKIVTDKTLDTQLMSPSQILVNDTLDTYLKLEGVPSEYMDKVVVGNVTVAITE